MRSYILRRLLLIPPTLLGIMVVNFIVIQTAPGGPVEQIIGQLSGVGVAATERLATSGGDDGNNAMSANDATTGGGGANTYRGARGLPPDLIADIERQLGFDKPLHERFLQMVWNYARFDFGNSFFQDKSVVQLVLDKMPVSISLGLWTTFLVFLISIPLGIKKALRDGSPFDVWTSGVIVLGNAIPAFLFAVLLIILFAGGRFLDWFPLRGLVSNDFHEMGLLGQIADYFWHLALPVLSMVIGGFAGLTLLTKNSFMEEIHKQYVMTAYAKGLTPRRVLYGHVFRNAMLIVIAGFPATFIGILFTGSLLTEIIFSLDGLGLLGFEAAINRDYPVMFATLYFFTLLGLIMGIIGDIMYHVVDPRIDFERRD